MLCWRGLAWPEDHARPDDDNPDESSLGPNIRARHDASWPDVIAGEVQRADTAGRSFRVHPPPPLLQHAEEEGQNQPKGNAEAEEPRRSAAQAAAGQPDAPCPSRSPTRRDSTPRAARGRRRCRRASRIPKNAEDSQRRQKDCFEEARRVVSNPCLSHRSARLKPLHQPREAGASRRRERHMTCRPIIRQTCSTS